MAWRLAGALITLRAGINGKWPNRDTRSDGTIGDTKHATRNSDHNPWVTVDNIGVVRALDTDVDGIDAGWYVEQLRLLGAAGDRRLVGGGYVIFNGRITRADWSGWAVYTGQNPHRTHAHVSLTRDPAGFDDLSPWVFLPAGGVTPPPTPAGRPTIQQGSTGPSVRDLQAHLQRAYPLYAKHLALDGVFGPATRAVVLEFQRRSGLVADGVVGPRTWTALGFR